MKRLAANLLILLVLGANLAVMLMPVWKLPASRLPGLVRDHFHVFNVFSSHERVNRDWQLRLLVEDGDSEEQWINPSIDAYFPFRRGEQHRRIVAHRVVPGWTPSHDEAREFLAERIRRVHETRHAQRVKSLEIKVKKWPRRDAGYFAGQSDESTRTQTWYQERFLR